MTAPSALLDLIGQARRRTLGALLFEHLSFALAIAFGACILLVLLGTQIFNWYWPVLLFAVALGYGYYRFRQQIPSDYALARTLDERLALPDTLSSAYHFTEGTNGHPEARQWLRGIAEEAARGADARALLPFQIKRVTYVAAAILAGFAGLIAVRYGFENRLDLQSPMVPGLVDLFGSGSTIETAQFRKNPYNRPPDPNNPQRADSPSTPEDQKEEAEAIGEAPKDVLKTIGVPEVDNQGAEQFKGEKGQEESEGPGENEKGSPGEQKEGGASKEGGAGEKQDGNQKNDPNGSQKSQNPEGNNSMLDKMRDAFSNLMNKMKSQPKGGEQQAKNGEKKGPGDSEGKQGDKQGQKGSQQQAKSNDQQGNSDQASEQQGEGEGKQQTAQGKGSSDGNQAQPNQDPKSGTGQQDGQKDVKLASQLEAMGKLSEIIGKRAEKQTGEVMVEVNSSKSQQLRTAYSQKSGNYTNSGGEIHRDEVPLLYQDYVQHYFEQVRRPAAAPAPATPAPAKPNTK